MSEHDTATVTVLREKYDRPTQFLTVEVDLDSFEVVNAIDEQGVPIPLTPGEENFAIRIVKIDGVDETGR